VIKLAGVSQAVQTALFTPKPAHVRNIRAVPASPQKTVYLVRHGQAEHNVIYENASCQEDKYKARDLVDPGLTALGIEQATVRAW